MKREIAIAKSINALFTKGIYEECNIDKFIDRLGRNGYVIVQRKNIRNFIKAALIVKQLEEKQ